MSGMIKRFIIRQVDDPTGLLKPVLKIHMPRHPALQEYFKSEADALAEIDEYGSDRNYMDWLILPVFIRRDIRN